MNPNFKKSVNIPNLSLTDEKFESFITDKCYKPHNLVKIYSSISLSKNAIVSDIRDFIKAMPCSETNHVFKKQRLARKMLQKYTQKIDFFQYFLSFVAKISIG